MNKKRGIRGAIFLFLYGVCGIGIAAEITKAPLSPNIDSDSNYAFDEEYGPFEMIAGVMEMNPVRNYTIIAEEKIILAYHYEKRKKSLGYSLS